MKTVQLNIITMFKKGIGYLLLVSFINMLTTLPAKCCEGSMPIHQHEGKLTVHSYTLLQHIIDMLGDETTDNNSVDVHHSVYHDTRRVPFSPSAQLFCKAGSTVSNAPFVATINYTGYNTRQFTLPPHYNYLFRLTPF